MNLMQYFADPTKRMNIADFIRQHDKVTAIKRLRSMFYADGSPTGWEKAPVVEATGDPFDPAPKFEKPVSTRTDFIGLAFAKFLVDACEAAYPDYYWSDKEVPAKRPPRCEPQAYDDRTADDERRELDDAWLVDSWGSWSPTGWTDGRAGVGPD